MWKSVVLGVLTKKWDAIRPYVDANRLSAFESLLAARKSLVEEAFAKRIENRELKQERRSLKARLMLTNVEKLWNKAKV